MVVRTLQVTTALIVTHQTESQTSHQKGKTPMSEHQNKTAEKSVPAKASSNQSRPEAQTSLDGWSADVRMRLKEAYGTEDEDFLKGILTQMLKCSPSRDEGEINFMASVIKQEKPKTPLDIMLMTQMIAVHSAAMRCAEQLALASDLTCFDSLVRAFDRLTRTFALQRDILVRCQPGSTAQTVAVQNVSVNEGAQAVVTNLMQNQMPHETAPDKPAVASPPAISHAETAPMSIIEESKEHVAVSEKIIRYRAKLK
jgi:hypothetical protein